jgi:hypothetical protein
LAAVLETFSSVYHDKDRNSGADWIDLAQDRDQWMFLVCTVMNLPVPKSFVKFLTG